MTCRNSILQGHALDKLRELPDNYVSCVCTSPPYWGLRKYAGEQEVIWGAVAECQHEWTNQTVSKTNDSNRGTCEWTTGGNPAAKVLGEKVSQGCFCVKCVAWKGALGLEPTPELYIQHLVQVFQEVKRVLRKDGVCYIVIGDSYAGSMKGYSPSGYEYGGEKQRTNTGSMGLPPARVENIGLKPKDRCLIPEHLVIALQKAGWWIRDIIIYVKKNSMPESCRDRRTDAYEQILMLTKSAKYWYDADAIKEKRICDDKEEKEDEETESDDEEIPFARNACNFMLLSTEPFGYEMCKSCRRVYDSSEYRQLSLIKKGRTTQQFAENPIDESQNQPAIWRCLCGSCEWLSHFAVFPRGLVKPLILAACPAWICRTCGKPRTRIIITKKRTFRREPSHMPNNTSTKVDSTGWEPPEPRTLGWLDCGHNNYGPGVVLDPFAGTGTTLIVAHNLGRDYLGIELSEEYIHLAKERMKMEAQKPLVPVTEITK